ncbi:hypothetical protein [Microvirga rosea]|uniref:hypothetical protein n=1 Tax=Microvirga rosea TaxID=2715425 RepID=UPI001D0A9E6B|nr:hypothetical protein [Microvirga rosea]MCB8821432.1 hypothetical protein [Microvirga rosea]
MPILVMAVAGFFALVISWAVTLLAAPSARRRKKHLDELGSQLVNDASSEADHRLVREALTFRVGPVAAFAFPVILPVTVLVLAVTGLIRRWTGEHGPSPLEGIEWARFQEHELLLTYAVFKGQGTLRADPRFRRLDELSFETEIFRFPILSVLTVLFAMPGLLFYAAVHGWREAIQLLPQIAFLYARALGPALKPFRPTPMTSGTIQATR